MLKIISVLSFFIFVTKSSVSAQSLCDKNAAESIGYLESFSVGDIVEPYSYYDSEKNKRVIGTPEKGMENTKWKIVEISSFEVQIELIEGEYIPWYQDGVIHKAGEYRGYYETEKEYLRKNATTDKSKPANISVFKCAN